MGTRGFSGYRWVVLGGAYQRHKEIEGVDGLQWYLGGGAAIYCWNYNDGFFFNDNYSNTSIGVQAYAGLDYSFADFPVNVTLDWVPTFFINGFGSGFGAGYGTLGVRYILGR